MFKFNFNCIVMVLMYTWKKSIVGPSLSMDCGCTNFCRYCSMCSLTVRGESSHEFQSRSPCKMMVIQLINMIIMEFIEFEIEHDALVTPLLVIECFDSIGLHLHWLKSHIPNRMAFVDVKNNIMPVERV